MITAVTRERRPIFGESIAATPVRRVLVELPEQHAKTHAWVLMPDHLHWLFELGSEASLSSLVQDFKSRSAIAINRAIGGLGPVWQAGFYDHRVRQHEDLLTRLAT